MTEWTAALPWVLGGLAVILALTALKRPVKWLALVAVRTGAGLGALALLGRVGEYIGITLGVNLWNALVMGVLGAPGFGLLLMLNRVLR